ncbi:hypothetical protein COCON_G00061700 [Conger conger]|uniref:Glutaredoxin domain-containing protein n=1 Tax=Conger conger TaxID=82655 RepID=A0A9Q1DS59_CONCO|nr:hypothetical protein COCON_G00061700 [Conger conger]
MGNFTSTSSVGLSSAASTQFVQDVITHNCVVIFSKTTCPYCARTVPRVFINGNCIGGGSDTKELHQQGKLLPLIEQCCLNSGIEGSGSGQFEPNTL